MESPTSNTQALPSGTRIEEFVIERVLGSGGFGITYLARDTRLDRQVVIKENLPAQFCFRDTHSLTVAPRHTHGEDADNFKWSLENFSKEAAMLASLDHPGIVKVLRSFQALGTAYFVMPFVEGVTLDVLLRKRQRECLPFNEAELRRLLEHVLDALAYLHERGIYHRDIKPGNLLITSEGLPVLIDFGSARQRLSERSMTVVESGGYTPFEQLQSKGKVGPWSDLYALGATFAKIITGEAPPKANDRAFGDPWQPLMERRDLKQAFTKRFLIGLDRALELPIKQRWQDARTWSAALHGGAMPAQSPGPLPPPLPEKSTMRGSQRIRRAAYGLLAVGVLVSISLGWWLISQGPASVPVQTVAAPAVLRVTSDPSGATVKGMSGKSLGSTPLELRVMEVADVWVGKLELFGYETAELRAELVSGETKAVPRVKLVKLPQRVIISSDPSGAEVVEDSRVLGVTPWEGDPRSVGSRVVLSLRMHGYEQAEVSGRVEVGKSLILTERLKAIPQQVIVASQPEGAEVLEGGAVIGKTPFTINQAPGTTVEYTVRLEGYEDAAVGGIVKIGEALIVEATLVDSAKGKTRPVYSTGKGNLPRVVIPDPSAIKRPVQPGAGILYPWRQNITASVFWIGPRPDEGDTVSNKEVERSEAWAARFGGVDNPDAAARIADHDTGEFRPKDFIPRLNPFYIALPYTDIASPGNHKPEASKVVPWFASVNPKAGMSVLNGRWVQIYNGKRSCYAQWEATGPRGGDDWEYVFHGKPPKSAVEKGAAIGIAPSVRDYLGLQSGQKCHWRFVEAAQVPYGPWKKYGLAAGAAATPGAADPDAQRRYLEYLRKLRDEQYMKKSRSELEAE